MEAETADAPAQEEDEGVDFEELAGQITLRDAVIGHLLALLECTQDGATITDEQLDNAPQYEGIFDKDAQATTFRTLDG